MAAVCGRPDADGTGAFSIRLVSKRNFEWGTRPPRLWGSNMLVLFVRFIQTHLKMTLTCIINCHASSTRTEVLAPPPTESWHEQEQCYWLKYQFPVIFQNLRSHTVFTLLTFFARCKMFELPHFCTWKWDFCPGRGVHMSAEEMERKEHSLSFLSPFPPFPKPGCRTRPLGRRAAGNCLGLWSHDQHSQHQHCPCSVLT